MTENKIEEAAFEDALHCAKSLVGDEMCEECRFYRLCHTWCDDVYRLIVDALEEIQQYRAIGTVEELQSKLEAYRELGTMEELKYLKLKEHNYDNCHNYTCRKKCEKDGYAKAIDEFAERLKDDILGHFRLWGIIEEPTDYCDCIDEVAEQLKGEKQ